MKNVIWHILEFARKGHSCTPKGCTSGYSQSSVSKCKLYIV